ncbi:hypothetical protein O7600_20155 [Micromonospora sp. WMMA1998]|uniref:hypothetical protein n=1 Tax=Micromonospora sp. WMMA1998 TaxID=3015167 RepID=UPI00248B090A|nr:hypothetical protein [Micromonospora sp. WMMA1998]WBC13445.1 hypothetical protein O7600_20155 [Micromonospora sp. WMMA1998]
MTTAAARPGPGGAADLLLARHAVYAALSGSTADAGYRAARAELEQLTIGQLLAVAATLALLLGRTETVLTVEEWTDVVDRIARGDQ